MRRLAAAAMALLLACLTPPPAAAEAPTIIWDTDRVVSSAIVVYENETLELRAGVNIRFGPGDGGDDGTRPTLGVMGGLLINGTAASRVGLSADEALWRDGEPDCLNIFNDGRTDRLSVQNATFRDMVIRIFFSGGVFRDCVFERCDLNLFRSQVALQNCTFIYSTVGSGDVGGADAGAPAVSLAGCRFDGMDPGSHPPPPYDTGDSDSPYPRAAIELGEPVLVEDCLIAGYGTAISAGLNNTFIRNCTAQDCGQGILLEGRSSEDTAEIRGCTVENATGFGLFALGGLRAKDCRIRDCAGAGLYSWGPLLAANCTVERCGTGLSLHSSGLGLPPDWLLLGNRLLGCSGYAVTAEGQEVDISGNRFEDGNITNGLGRLLVSRPVRLAVLDPAGRSLTGAFLLEWTDGAGGSGSRTIYPDDAVPFDVFSIGSDGARTDYFPYSLRLSRGVIENRTAMPSAADTFKFVLQVLPDLVLVHLSTDYESIRYRQDTSFLVRVQNNGSGVSRECPVVFLVDGLEVDRTRVPALGLRAAASVYSHPWKATAGRHTLTARLDPAGTVSESDRTNNDISIAFDVAAPPDHGFPAISDSGLPFMMVIVLVTVAIVACITAAVRVSRRRRKWLEGPPGPEPDMPEGFSWQQKQAPEPRPATMPGEAKPARIKCPKCGTEAEVKDPARPLTIKCETCGSLLRLAG